MKFSALPFHIGPTPKAHNPGGLPDTLAYEVAFDPIRGTLAQVNTPLLEATLTQAYKLGQFFGTPLADDPHGRPYTDDFLGLVDQPDHGAMRALEIGAGVGYVSRRLKDAGWQVTSLEPGVGYADHWARYGIEVIQEFFPTPQAPGPYDLIIAYGVIEHIPEPLGFLRSVLRHLAPEGRFVASVPDCSAEILAGDPAILLHEHYSYFTQESLAGLLETAGFHAVAQPSRFGRCLYITGRHPDAPQAQGAGSPPDDAQALASALRSYPERVGQTVEAMHASIEALVARGSLGVYAAARGLAIMEPSWPLRFFDDDAQVQGRFYPPFSAKIEPRAALLAQPVDQVLIVSRTFGHKIRDSLRADGYQGPIMILDELLEMR